MENADVKVRLKVDGDTSFLLNSWLKSYYHSSYFCKRIREKIYYRFHHEVITRILGQPNTKVLIASDPIDTSVILGYLVYNEFECKPLIHYAYVKGAFRQMGIATTLIKAAELDLSIAQFTHWSFDCDEIVKKHPNMVYTPYLI